MMSPSQAIREPRQLRGLDTRERILGAAERLLRRGRLEEITIGDIVSEARTSVGSFYHLFGSKEAIIAPLYARYDQNVTEKLQQVFRRARKKHRTLEGRVRWTVRYAVRSYRNERGLLRAMALHARSHPGNVTSEQHGHRATFYDQLADLLLECRSEVTHPDPQAAIRLGLFFVAAACRDKILFSDAPHPKSIAMGDRALTAELSRALLAYLCVPVPEPGA